jgi:hypothetical protein
MRRLIVIVLGAIAVAGAGCGSSTPTSNVGHKSAAQLLAASLSAAKASGSAHYVLVSAGGGQTQTVTGNASGTDANQVITTTGSHAEALYVGGKEYIMGNATGLENEMGFSSAVAPSFAGKWIAIASTDSPYQTIAKALGLLNTLKALEPTGHLTLTAVTTRAGHQVVGVSGSLPASAGSSLTGTVTIYVATTGAALPIAYSARASGSGGESATDSGTFSAWGEPVHLTAPTHTVPLSSVPTTSG